jgi:pimeloyl-ACP methyl ester carboxylesterase
MLGLVYGASILSTARESLADPKERLSKASPRLAPWQRLPATPSLPKALRQGLARINRTEIFYAQFGKGPPVVLLHGGLANSNYWGNQVEALSQNFSVTVMDTRGHGRSPVTSNTFSYEVFAKDVVSLLDYLEIASAAIVAWSDGAITGIQLALAHPDRLSKLFAFGANATPEGLKAGGAKTGAFASFVSRCKKEYLALSPHPERWPELQRGLRIMWRTEPNFTKLQLATITMPITIADGEYDEIIKPEHTRQIAAGIKGSRLVILPNVSHFAMLQNPAQFTGAANNFS